MSGLRSWLTYTLSLKRQRKWTKDLWPSEALVLTLVASASQRKEAVTASPRGSGDTRCVEEGDKARHCHEQGTGCSYNEKVKDVPSASLLVSS